MKSFALLLTIFLASAAHAGNDFTCFDNSGDQMVMTLEQIGNAEITDGDSYQYTLKLIYSETVLLETKVNVKVEDVIFNFKGRGVAGTIFLDELDQTWLKWKGTEYTFNCEPGN